MTAALVSEQGVDRPEILGIAELLGTDVMKIESPGRHEDEEKGTALRGRAFKSFEPGRPEFMTSMGANLRKYSVSTAPVATKMSKYFELTQFVMSLSWTPCWKPTNRELVNVLPSYLRLKI